MAAPSYNPKPEPVTIGQQLGNAEALDRLDRIEALERDQAIKLAEMVSFIQAKLDGQEKINDGVADAIAKLTEQSVLLGRELQRVDASVPMDHIPAAELRMELEAQALRINSLEESRDETTEQLLRIEKKIAWFSGGVAVVVAGVELLPRFWPYLAGGAG